MLGPTNFHVAGVDGTPGGWAALIAEFDQTTVHRVASLSEIFKSAPDFDLIAIDIPIGLLDTYRLGGRICDCEARRALGSPRGSSVFPAPVRGVLVARSPEEASAIS